jgi:hypothetical protein
MPPKKPTDDVNEQQAEPKDNDDEMSLNVLYYQQSVPVSASTHDEITDEVRKHLHAVEELHVQQIGDDQNLTAGNQEDLNFLEETTVDLRQCQEERASLKDSLADYDFKITQLQEKVRVLESQSQYRSTLRMQFLSTFKRDHLPLEYDVTHDDAQCIKEGNSQAHDPDPVGDADLYLEGERIDENAFKCLYGFSPGRINTLSESSHDPAV